MATQELPNPSQSRGSATSLTLRERLQALLDGHDPVYGRSVALLIQGLIVLSLISVAVETLPDLPPWLRRALFIEEWIIVVLFLVEYLARVYAAPRRLAYVTSPLGILDLISFAPTLLLLGYDTRFVRALRALRILRLFKLMRYVAAFERLGLAVRTVIDELVVFAGIAFIAIYLCSAGIYFFEHEAQPEAFASIFHATWWTVVTLTTVGYGDIYPITAGGRIFTIVMLVLGLGVVAVPTALVTSALGEVRPHHVRDLEQSTEASGATPPDRASRTGNSPIEPSAEVAPNRDGDAQATSAGAPADRRRGEP